VKHWREAIKLLLVSVVLLLLSGCNTSSVSTMNINIKKGANFGPGSKVFVEARDGDVASLTVKMMNHLMSNGYSVTDLSDADFRVDYSYGYTKINTNYVHDVRDSYIRRIWYACYCGDPTQQNVYHGNPQYRTD